MCHPGCETCFCFRDVRRAIVAIGILTGVCSFVQILTTIAVFTGFDHIEGVEHEDPEGYTYRLYIALACFDFVMIIVSFILVYGNERSNGMSRCSTLPWVILLPFYFLFETGTNIYYFYHQFTPGAGFEGPLMDGSHAGFAVVPLVYWITKAVLLFTSFLYLVCRLHTGMPSPQVKYVRQVESFHEYDSAPSFPHASPMMALPPPPSITRYSPMMSLPAPSCPRPSPMMSMPPAPSCPRPSPMLSMPPASSYPRPSAPQCTSCSGGCSADRCNKCNLPQPLYGYAGGMQGGNSGMQMGNGGMQMGNGGNCGGRVESKGWTTSVYNTGH